MPPTSWAQPVHLAGLGTLDFPNSGAPSAQDPFLRGVLLLHSFEFGPAATAFREAQDADPAFALAYWGEAMTYNHPLWRARDMEAGRLALGRLADTPAARRQLAGAEREAGYMDAVEILYGDGAKEEQDLAYMDAMASLHNAYPKDDEARTFYALSILGSTNGERDFATYMRGAAVAMPVFEGNPDHPGAAHYLIHSFDDPIHAPLGLAAADAYAEIAPDAAHAQHMTTHIFVALGLWERVVQANIRAMRVQDAARAADGTGPNTCGHYASWRHYGHLMLGQLEEAGQLMDACHADVVAGRGNWFYFTVMRARHIMDSEDWTLAGRWVAEPPVARSLDDNASVFGGPGFTYQLTNAMAGIMAGSTDLAEAMLVEDWPDHPGRTLQLDQLRGLMMTRGSDLQGGLDLLRTAAEADAALPFEFGPPGIVKPGYELLASELHRAGRNAADAYRQASLRTPGRPLAAMPATPHGSH
ncbi:MAG: hypothetical protein ACI84D_003887 [Thalassolituus oleivorans]